MVSTASHSGALTLHACTSCAEVFSSMPDVEADTSLVHLCCLLAEHPELAHSVEEAREHGEWISDD